MPVRTGGCLLMGRIRILVLTLQSIILIVFLSEVLGPVKYKWIVFHNNERRHKKNRQILSHDWTYAVWTYQIHIGFHWGKLSHSESANDGAQESQFALNSTSVRLYLIWNKILRRKHHATTRHRCSLQTSDFWVDETYFNESFRSIATNRLLESLSVSG